ALYNQGINDIDILHKILDLTQFYIFGPFLLRLWAKCFMFGPFLIVFKSKCLALGPCSAWFRAKYLAFGPCHTELRSSGITLFIKFNFSILN
ncbi:hypothetical protein, partial [Tetragenococcus halophilus]|uniref:hypothetical protein n=1 Tax=Tetragenococcus halophilus TaxID=51669 RepID=UPI001CA5C88E